LAGPCEAKRPEKGRGEKQKNKQQRRIENIKEWENEREEARTKKHAALLSNCQLDVVKIRASC